MKLIVVTGNAFIELFEHDMPMALTKGQLIGYSEEVSKKLGKSVDISGVGLTELRFNYNKIIEITKEGIIVPAKDITDVELKARFRSNITPEELAAFTSIPARKKLGISNLLYSKKTYL